MSTREARWAQKRQQFLSTGSAQPPVQLPPPLGTFLVDFSAAERSIQSDLRGAAAQSSFMAVPAPPPGPAQAGGGVWRPHPSQLPPPHPVKDALDFALGGASVASQSRKMTRDEAWAAKRAQGGSTGGTGLGVESSVITNGGAANYLQHLGPLDGSSRSNSRGSANGTLGGVGLSQVSGYQRGAETGGFLNSHSLQQSMPYVQQRGTQQLPHYQAQQPSQNFPSYGRQTGGGRSSIQFG